MSRRPSGRPRTSSRESPGVQVLRSPDHPTPTPALPFPLSIHFNFWASDQIMKPRLIKQHGAKQMGPLVTARKIAPPTQITVESVLMTSGGSISAPNTTDCSGLNYNRYKQRLEFLYRHQHQNERFEQAFGSYLVLLSIISTSDHQHNYYMYQYQNVWNLFSSRGCYSDNYKNIITNNSLFSFLNNNCLQKNISYKSLACCQQLSTSTVFKFTQLKHQRLSMMVPLSCVERTCKSLPVIIEEVFNL